MKNRYYALDVMRSVAIIGVLVIHVTATVLPDAAERTWTEGIVLFLNQAFRFAVPAFLFLSGLGLSLSDNSKLGYFAFLNKRLSKILLLYVLWSIVYHAVSYQSFVPLTFLKELVTGGAYYHLYYMPLIILFYLLYPVLYRIGSTMLGLLGALVLSAASQLIATYAGIPLFGNLLNPLNWLVYFVLGIWFAEDFSKKLAIIRNYKPFILPLYFAALFGLFLETYLTKGIIGVGIATTSIRPSVILYSCLFFMMLLGAWPEGRQPATFTLRLSKLSYGIYLSHAAVLSAISAVYRELGMPQGTVVFLVVAFVSVVCLSVLLSLLSYVSIHRTKTWMNKSVSQSLQ
ncbi:acyltransferase [Paenibacillus nanensis]|uniref:Acyltransferase n=1 Tax=Paenibacillus nanensis TaxID=393251 RepID=A0A3A1UVQ4_9BACL|nr:acyltransferase [Paenibacillus nanensis]RIX52629.1 acyltransferase [Paenibacillus nanensis]